MKNVISSVTSTDMIMQKVPYPTLRILVPESLRILQSTSLTRSPMTPTPFLSCRLCFPRSASSPLLSPPPSPLGLPQTTPKEPKASTPSVASPYYIVVQIHGWNIEILPLFGIRVRFFFFLDDSTFCELISSDCSDLPYTPQYIHTASSSSFGIPPADSSRCRIGSPRPAGTVCSMRSPASRL